jgi:protein arginine kinase activator
MANVHVTQILNNETTVFHLCEECAHKKGISISIADAPSTGKTHEQETESETVCPRCHLTLREFKEKGRLGCAECYGAFAPEVDRLLVQVHGTSVHKGKRYTEKSVVLHRTTNIKRLRLELDNAIRNEQFELAAELRDAIQSLCSQDEI